MSSRPLPRVRSLVLEASAANPASAFALSMLSTHPELGTFIAAGTTSEADTVIRSQPRIACAHRHDDADHDRDRDRDDTSDSVWRRRIVVRGSDKAVPLPWP